ncbi:MAG: ABC transporter ATP-binding protein [Burkholderiales bacterium]|nr:ABC transporter ATP-binding protein [Burkholderiales bacterium]
MADVLLAAEGLTRLFGGLAANRDVSLSLARGEVHALLGPNGAGKSTCINLLSGDLPVTSGRVLLRGKDVTALPNHKRSLAGIGRSYQRTNIFAKFTAFENCRLAAQSRDPRAWRILSDAHGTVALRDRGRAALEQAGLGARADIVAATLSHGEQRQLEIAMVLATGAAVLLLDEPLAGMGSEESARMIELLKQLRPAHAILLVEHDMDAVFEVADRVTVMVEGRVLESGPPAQIRASAAVREAYLGEPV